MTEFRVARRQGLIVGLFIIAAILLLDAGCVYLIRTRAISLLTFGLNLLIVASAAGIALMAYWLWGLLHASYSLDRNQLVVRWGQTRQIVPLSSIERAVDGADVDGRAQLRALHWPGYVTGPGRVRGLGTTLFYATRPLRQQVLLVTPAVTYAISPVDKQGFLDAFHVRHRMGATQQVEQASLVPGWLHWEVWRDRAAYALVLAAIVLNLALFGFLSVQQATLPAQTPLHFNTDGAVDRWGTPPEMFFLPFIGLAVLALNGVVGGLLHVRWRETAAAYLLWGGAALMQLFLWVATISLLSAPYARF